MSKILIGFITILIIIGSRRSLAQCSEREILNLRKTALVIGQKSYKYAGALKNPANDAHDISDSLKNLGFVVKTYVDTDLASMNAAIDDWCLNLPNFDVALFFYSGHGLEVDGINYLVPTDANLQAESDLSFSAFSANKLLARMEKATTRYTIMLLDACRSNPFSKGWTKAPRSIGLSAMSGRGAFIGFASSPGTVASDGLGRNSPYTEAILKLIMTPNKSIDQIFTKVNQHVRQFSKDTQIPYKNSSLSVDFCFSVDRSEKKIHNLVTPSSIPISSHVFLSPLDSAVYTVDTIEGSVKVWDARTLMFRKRISFEGLKIDEALINENGVLAVVDKVKRKVGLLFNGKTKIFQMPLDIVKVVGRDENNISCFLADSVVGKIIEINSNSWQISQEKKVSPYSEIVVENNTANVILVSYNNGETSFLEYDLRKKTRELFASSMDSLRVLIGDKEGVWLTLNGGRLGILQHGKLRQLKKIAPIPNISNPQSFQGKLSLLSDNSFFILDTLTTNPKLFKFRSRPLGYACSSGGEIYVWINQESRLMVLNENDLSESTVDGEIEVKYQMLLQQLKNSKESDGRSYYAPIFDKVRARINRSVIKIAKELAQEKIGQVSSKGNNDYQKGCCTYRDGIAQSDGMRKVINSYSICIDSGVIVVSMTEEDTGKVSQIHIGVSDENWDLLDKEVDLSMKRRISALFL